MTEKTTETAPETLARRLDEAWERRQPVAPLSESEGLTSAEDAYAVQTAWNRLRLERGERVVGRKIGLTSRAIQEQLGVSEPDYGNLWASRHFRAEDGRVEFPAEAFIEPRLEGEISFLMSRPLRGPDVTIEEVLGATEAVAAAFEVVDSRISDWRITLADTVADNASYGAFTTGPWDARPLETDLRTLGMLLHKNGETAETGVGAAALGHPARAVAWLANKLSSFGVNLEAGDVVLSGALSRAVPARRGDAFVLEIHGQPLLTATFV